MVIYLMLHFSLLYFVTVGKEEKTYEEIRDIHTWKGPIRLYLYDIVR